MTYTQEQLQRTSTYFRDSWRRAGDSTWWQRLAINNTIAALRSHEECYQWQVRVLGADEIICCESCGEEIGFIRDGETTFRYEDVVEVDGHVFCNYDCAANDGYHECENCGTYIHEDDEIYVDGSGSYCSSECAEEHGFRQCEECEEWGRERDGFYVGDRFFCCTRCAERAGLVRCEHCGEWVDEYDTRSVGDETWCDWCVDDHARYCDECEEYFDESDVDYFEDSDQHLCRSCQEEVGYRLIGSWNYCPPITFFGSASSPRMGVELETDGGRNRLNYAKALSKIEGFQNHFWMTDDGSLQDGVEITSHPMSLAYHESLMGLYEEIGETANRFGYASHNGGRCGLHVSIPKDWFGKTEVVQDAGIYKLMRLTQRFERQLTTFSRRLDNHWCEYRTSYDYSPKKETVSVKGGTRENSLLAKSYDFKMNERTKYRAVNICHRNHVEIRIFRGTLKWSTYFASLALVDGLARVVKKHGSVWVESVTWYDLMDEVVKLVKEGGNEKSSEYLAAYLADKGLC